MGYRKVSYLEQMCYIVKYGLKYWFIDNIGAKYKKSYDQHINN